MSLYGKYIKEREGREIIETSDAFATYTFLSEDTCYITDIYVDPVARSSGKASELADQITQIAKEKGCTKLIGSAQAGLPSSATSFMVLLRYGMRPVAVEGNLVYFLKEI